MMDHNTQFETTRTHDSTAAGHIQHSEPADRTDSTSLEPANPEPTERVFAEPTVSIQPVTDRMARVTVTIEGRQPYIDEFNLHSAAARAKFIEAVRTSQGIDPDKLGDLLVSYAFASAAPVEIDTSGSDIDGCGLQSIDKASEAALSNTPEGVVEAARSLLTHPDLLTQIIQDVQATGVAGEDDLIAACYLIMVSRNLEQPLSAVIQGSSSSGKSHVLDRVGRLMPDEAVVRATDLTPNSLYHMRPGSLVHRVVIAGERKRGKDQGEATRALREMISGGELSKAVPVNVGGVYETCIIRQPGPIAFIETTTLNEIFEEDASRCILLSSDESPEQSRRIIEFSAWQASLPPADIEAIRAKHQTLQRLLKRVVVIVPYAAALCEGFPLHDPAARRAFEQLLGLIKASALLHQVQRSEGPLHHGDAINATTADYEIVRRLLLKPLAKALGSSLRESTTTFADWLAQEFDNEPFSARDVQRSPRSPVTSRDKILRHARLLVDQGKLLVMQPARGAKPTVWQLTGDCGSADATGWLPQPEDIMKLATGSKPEKGGCNPPTPIGGHPSIP